MSDKVLTGDMRRELARRTGLSRKQVRLVQTAYGEWVLEQIGLGRTVMLPGIGRIQPVTRRCRPLPPSAFGTHPPGATTAKQRSVKLVLAAGAKARLNDDER